MNAPELKPCPFCGSAAQLSSTMIAFQYVRCSNNACAVKISSYKNQDAAIKQWNTRHDIHAAVVAENEELRRQRDLLAESLAECHQYMKDEETPAQCIKRNRDDMTGLLSLLADERRTVEQLRARLDAAMEWVPVASGSHRAAVRSRVDDFLEFEKRNESRMKHPDTAQAGEQQRCEYCDNTGDIHGFDGEWRGECPRCKPQHPASEGDAEVKG